MGRKMNIRKLLERKVRQHRDKPFIIFLSEDQQEEILTYRQFDDKVNRFANWLLQRGIQKGDFVLTHLPNSIGFLVSLHACTKIGAVMIPSIIFDVTEDLEYKLNFSEAKLVITDGKYYPIFNSIHSKCPSVKDIVIYRSAEKIPGTHCWEDILAGSSPELVPVDIDPMDNAEMLFTSGTTARPKGVILTNANFLYIGEICCKHFIVTPDDRYLIYLPLFHIHAQCVLYFACLTAGGSLVLCERFSASRFSSWLRNYHCTICTTAAPIVRMVLAQLENPLDKENKMWRGPYAFPISEEEWDTFERRFNTILVEGYGSTETLGPATMVPIWGERPRRSVGLPHFGTEVKIVDDDRNEMPIGEKGEIAIKGQPGISLFKEYYKNPGATAESLVDGWFYSEDYGRMDEDGYLYMLDRKKDMIKRAGENIASAEVERVLNTHPAVEESTILGVPDPIRDEAVLAIIRFKEGKTATEEELIEFCNEKMAKFKVPGFWVFRKEDFPKTSVGKIKKNILREEILKDWKIRETKK